MPATAALPNRPHPPRWPALKLRSGAIGHAGETIFEFPKATAGGSALKRKVGRHAQPCDRILLKVDHFTAVVNRDFHAGGFPQFFRRPMARGVWQATRENGREALGKAMVLPPGGRALPWRCTARSLKGGFEDDLDGVVSHRVDTRPELFTSNHLRNKDSGGLPARSILARTLHSSSVRS